MLSLTIPISRKTKKKLLWPCVHILQYSGSTICLKSGKYDEVDMSHLFLVTQHVAIELLLCTAYLMNSVTVLLIDYSPENP